MPVCKLAMSQNCYMAAWAGLFTYLQCPRATTRQPRVVCSHVHHVPASPRNGLGSSVSTCAVSSANTWQQRHACCYPCFMPVLPHAAWAHLFIHMPYPALPFCYGHIYSHCGMPSAIKSWPLGIPVYMPAMFQHCHMVASACMFIPT